MGIAHNDLQRSLAKMTVHFHRAVEARAHQSDLYKLAEREQQYQIQVSGYGGLDPAEVEFTVPFEVYFIGDPGLQRASTSVAPQIRTGWEFTRRPIGLVTYAHVTEWLVDDALNYSGCKMIAGIHLAAALPDGTDATFKATLHVSFQGWGAVFDGDDDDSPDNGTS